MYVRFCALQDSRVRAKHVLHSLNRLYDMRYNAHLQRDTLIVNFSLWFTGQFSLFIKL